MSGESHAPESAGSIRSRIAAHPVAAFLILAIPLAWLAQALAIVLLQDITPGLLVELLVLLGTAVLVTAAAEGRAGVRRLFAGVVRWRVAAGWYVIALLALPVLTLLTAVVTGTLREPGSGWASTAGLYLLKAVVIGALLGNVWEELAWAGVVQRRLMDRKGVLAGSLLTAVPFALIHLPQAFAQRGFAATPWADVALSWAVLFGFAAIARYLLGMVFVGTGGSILVLGLLHGSMNASQGMDTVDWWQFIPAVVVLTAAVAAYLAVRSRTTGQGSSGHALRRRRIRPLRAANP
ncbi:membrane protease YdiL (CAAX protease family) [Arthrobacter sp. PvP102]|uniref:CPBP family intramembrane glutamic endopeptidase n=1 Tax=unclassified Arthrobacter TaxID=235627 RepID=UPI001AE42DFB|nr:MULTISPECIES: CPBP family intramembrane glutamic endopeptidase [unclassified Arthrobacter]MBP1232825.1 membrane protease YdiL (CAAX protease family) [Arthrobacter sp. PvP103]MBP1237960.1 membrane protease YdiL (CAAX protease family) [Arthrobacter sp. PvP102]